MKYYCDYCEKPLTRSELPSIARYAEEDEDVIMCPQCQKDLSRCKSLDEPIINYTLDKRV